MPSIRPNRENAIAPRLGLWDTVSIIVGVVVGTAIFRSAPMVFASAGGPVSAMGLWVAGGALAWCGAVCYAELATTYPRDGGDYEYLNRAFGPWCGFVFAWAQLTTVVSGNIAIMACAFADYGVRLLPGWQDQAAWLAVAPVVGLSALNALGVVAGKWSQNLLTTAKVAGIAGLVAAGVLAAFNAQSAQPRAAPAVDTASATNFGLALVFVLYAYGGWSHAAYVSAEVREQRRNLPRALLVGIAGVMLVYLAVNGGYLAALGFDGARSTATPAADVLEMVSGPWGGNAISLLVMLSALGAINGMVLTASRIYAVWGADYPALAWLGEWNRRTAAPIVAIVVQAAIATLLILLVGTSQGRDWFDAGLQLVGLRSLPWGDFLGGFEMLVAGSAPVYWALSLLTGVAVLVLRIKDRAIERPFRVPLFPLPALLYCGTCAFMAYASWDYARWLALIGLLPLLLGCLLWLLVRVRPPAK